MRRPGRRRSRRPRWSNRSGSGGLRRRSSARSPCRASSAAHSGPENMPTSNVGSNAANIAVAIWAGTALSGSLPVADPRLVADDDDPRAAADRDVARQDGLGHDDALVLLDAVDRDRDPVRVDVLEALGDRADVERRDRERREGPVTGRRRLDGAGRWSGDGRRGARAAGRGRCPGRGPAAARGEEQRDRDEQ